MGAVPRKRVTRDWPVLDAGATRERGQGMRCNDVHGPGAGGDLRSRPTFLRGHLLCALPEASAGRSKWRIRLDGWKSRRDMKRTSRSDLCSLVVLVALLALLG